MGKNKKSPRFGEKPSGAKAPKFGAAPERSDDERPCWQLGNMDFDGLWSWRSADKWEVLGAIHSKLRNLETMRWSEILKASGGKSAGKGNNNHSVSVANLCQAAQKRLKDLGHKDVSELFSLRLSGKERIWGIKNGRVLRVIWYDPKHEVCPSS